MPRFKFIESAEDLAGPGTGYEKSVFDLKRTYQQKQHAEMAKDVAAFANHLGGTILIGADEDEGAKVKYVPLSETEVGRIKTDFEKAVRDRCSPKPIVHPAIIYWKTGYLLAVNIEPFLGLVGVLDLDGDSAKKSKKFQIYPVRTTTQTVYLYPEQLPMYMNSEMRRVTILLSKTEAESNVIVRDEIGNERELTFKGMDAERNIFVTETIDSNHTRKHRPIDRVLSVYPGTSEREWHIVVKSL